MKRLAVIAVLFAIGYAPVAHAQDHAEVGAFVDYFRLSQTKSNFAGVGARLAVNVVKYVQIEAEMAYDFNQVFTEGFTSSSGGAVTSVGSNIKVLHGLIGPKIQTSGPVRLFVTFKGGAADFRFDPRPASFSTFTSSADNLRSSNVRGALYPGTGAEAFLGPIGLRIDVGDEIIFANGAHHNWKVTFGPQIRF